jgi:PAS domain S-box-containing protein
MRSSQRNLLTLLNDSRSRMAADRENNPRDELGGSRRHTSLAHADFSSVVELIKDYAVFLLDAEGNVATWNLGAQRIKGYRAEEIIGKHFSRFYTSEDVEAGLPATALRKALEEGRFEKEGWRVRKDGTRFWADVVITPVSGSGGDLTGFVKVTRDLTERKLTEESLRQSRERSRLLVENLRDYAIFFIDMQGTIGSWNSGAERVTGYHRDDVVGKPLSILYPAGEIEQGRPQRDLEMVAREWRVEYEGWRVRKDGSRFQAEFAMWVLYDDAGTTIGYIVSIKDLTERNKAQEELALRLAAESALRERDEFLSMVSHELRSPLAALKLNVQTIREELKLGNTERMVARLPDRLDRVQKQADRVEELISRMMNASVVAAGKTRLVPQAVDLSVLAAAVVADMAETAKQANCELSLHAPEPVVGEWSPEHIQEVIRNLVQNALKFGRGEPVQVTVGGDTTHGWVSVEDRGIGIAEVDQERIFGRFQRAVNPRNYAGFGLGLWIAKETVQVSGGKISVRSQPGEGATFMVSLPRTLSNRSAGQTALSSENEELENGKD